MKLILFLLRLSPGIVTVTFIVGLITGFSNTALLALISKVLSSDAKPAGTLAWGFIGLCLLMITCRITSEVLLVRLSQGANLNMRMQLCRQILSAPLRHLEEIGAHRILSTLIEDVGTISASIASLPLLCMHAAIVTGCVLYMGWLSWKVLIAVLAFMAIAVATYRLPAIKAAKYVRLGNEERDKLFKHFRTLTDGAKELKLHRRRREAFISQVIQSTAEAFNRNMIIANNIHTFIASWGHLLVFTLVGLLLLALPGMRVISHQTLTSYVIVILYMMTPMEVLLSRIPTLSRANIALERIADLGLLLVPDRTKHLLPEQRQPDARWESLELVNVTHAYHNEKDNCNFTLGPIDLRLRLGEIIFLTGGNGSGKTTLSKLLTGLYIPESGEIRVNGQEVTDSTREQYRQHFSVVFSDFCLFESLLGLDNPELDRKAHDYLVQLQLDHKTQIVDGRLSTTALSQGQRKRLALLTAYLEDRPFYVFDEWAADQDPTFKDIFYNKLILDLKNRGKTILVISHDERYYHIADRVVKLNYGKIDYDSRNLDLACASREADLVIE